MALTALMFVVLIVSYALMFGLVKFSENVIALPEVVSADDKGAESQRRRGRGVKIARGESKSLP